MSYKHRIRRFGQALRRSRRVEIGNKLDLEPFSEAIHDGRIDSAVPKLDHTIFSSQQLLVWTGEIYRPLLEGQFRVIRLLSGDASDPIHCELEIYQLGTPKDPQKYGCPLYEAISYVWGNPKDTVEILIGPERQPLLVTRNLFELLNVFRYPDKARMMWADAVCINQADLDERGSQVAMMGAIYSTCERCDVWLGHENEPNFGHMPPVYGLDAEHWELATSAVHREAPTLDLQAAIELLHLRFDPSARNDHEKLEELMNKTAMITLIDILSRAWWFRLWTFQEAILPLKHGKAVRLCIGGQNLDFEWFLDLGKSHSEVCDLDEICSMFAHRSRAGTDLDTALMLVVLTPLACMLRLIRIFAEGNGYLHLDIATSRMCSDPRDAIYALIGLSDYPLFDGLPDYSISISHCYSRATKTRVNAAFGLNHLCWINPVLSTTSRPSWALDFQRGVDSSIDYDSFPYQSEDPIYAISSQAPPDVLPVRACFLSAVTKVLPACTWDCSPECSVRTLRDWHEEAPRLDALDRQLSEILTALDPEMDLISVETNGIIGSSRFLRLMSQFLLLMSESIEQRAAFIIAEGKRVGIAYDCVQPGDIIATLVGLEHQCVLRPEILGRVLESGYVTSEKSYLFLGACSTSEAFSYAYGKMNGKPWMDIDLV